MTVRYIFYLLSALFLVSSCSGTTQPPKIDVIKKFAMPEIPIVLTTPKERAEFLITNYWKHFNFQDTSLISIPDITEQGYVDFLDILPQVELPIAQKGIQIMMDSAKADSLMFTYFMELSEKYLYDPNSPFRNEEYYISVLQSIISNEKLDEINKVRPRYQLELAFKNRTGEKATDFPFTAENGKQSTLYKTYADPLLLFFFVNDCENCKNIKQYVSSNEIEKLVKILYVDIDKNPQLDSLYDLRATPTLYLLTKDKRVLLKDAPIEEIESYLKK